MLKGAAEENDVGNVSAARANPSALPFLQGNCPNFWYRYSTRKEVDLYLV